VDGDRTVVAAPRGHRHQAAGVEAVVDVDLLVVGVDTGLVAFSNQVQTVPGEDVLVASEFVQHATGHRGVGGQDHQHGLTIVGLSGTDVDLVAGSPKAVQASVGYRLVDQHTSHNTNTNRNDIKGSRRSLELFQRGFEEAVGSVPKLLVHRLDASHDVS
jgi:hypothetical protein